MIGGFKSRENGGANADDKRGSRAVAEIGCLEFGRRRI